jgi:hypothetical protein
MQSSHGQRSAPARLAPALPLFRPPGLWPKIAGHRRRGDRAGRRAWCGAGRSGLPARCAWGLRLASLRLSGRSSLAFAGETAARSRMEPSGNEGGALPRLVRCARLGFTSKGFRNLGGLSSPRGRRRERFSSLDPPQTLWCPRGPGCCLTRPPGCPQAWAEASPTIKGCRSRSRCRRLDSATSQKSRMSSGDRLQKFTGAR